VDKLTDEDFVNELLWEAERVIDAVKVSDDDIEFDADGEDVADAVDVCTLDWEYEIEEVPVVDGDAKLEIVLVQVRLME
jgi:hypothetical protein